MWEDYSVARCKSVALGGGNHNVREVCGFRDSVLSIAGACGAA
jgi:hypothetical protein